MADLFNVAVVDDDPRLRKLIVEELTDEGVRPLACETGQKLLDLLQSESVDLILLDLMMPEMDGFFVLKNLSSAQFRPL
jgi:Response regulator containing CheY-like receiver, AAA-type ATPase, and DNA-binding domains